LIKTDGREALVGLRMAAFLRTLVLLGLRVFVDGRASSMSRTPGLAPGWPNGPSPGWPSATIASESIRCNIMLPGEPDGFYQGTRFEKPVITSLVHEGHQYHGLWFNWTNTSVRDWEFQGNSVVAGLASAAAGPVEKFSPVGYDEAKPGNGTFVVIGNGVLRRSAQDTGGYDAFHTYEVVDAGKWSVTRVSPSAIRVTHHVQDAASGFGYIYNKTIELRGSSMVLTRSLRNTGEHTIKSSEVLNHNFLTFDHQITAAGTSVTVPFKIAPDDLLNTTLGELRNSTSLVLKQTLDHHQMVVTAIAPAAKLADGSDQIAAADTLIVVESPATGLGVRIQGDYALEKIFLFAIRSLIAPEPIFALELPQGAVKTWSSTYTYYKLTGATKVAKTTFAANAKSM